MKPVFLIGFMGAGKTTVGQILAQKLNLQFVDLDHFIENKTKLTIAEYFEKYGEKSFREVERESLITLSQRENLIIATGGGAPCFADNMQIIKQSGMSFYLKWTNENLFLRLKIDGTDKRPLLKGKSDAEIMEYISKSMTCRETFFRQADFTVSAENDEAMADKIASWFNWFQ